MTSIMPPEWIELIRKKFEKQVGLESTLFGHWMNTTRLGVEKKGEQYYRKAQEIFNNPCSMRILDAGCGDGSVALRFAIAGADVVGVDIDCEFIEIAQLHAKEEYPQISANFICADLCDRSVLKAADFDLIICIDVIEHVSSGTEYLENLKKLLRPNGKIWLFTPNRFALTNIIADPHYQLFGLTLLPNSWAEWYAVHGRRRTDKYEVTRLYSQSSLEKMVGSLDLMINYHTANDFDSAIKRYSWLKKIIKIPVMKTLAYYLYRNFWISTIEATINL